MKMSCIRKHGEYTVNMLRGAAIIILIESVADYIVTVKL